MNTEFDFNKMNGLLPAVVQDSSDGEVLMVGFMNRPALERPGRTGPDQPALGGPQTLRGRTRHPDDLHHRLARAPRSPARA